jgi:hypothetical protein
VIELIVKSVAVNWAQDHPWAWWLIGGIAAIWIGGAVAVARDEQRALKAKRQEAVDLIAELRDRRAREMR